MRSFRLLVAARGLAGLTQTELAKAARVGLSVLQAVEQGRSDPKLSTVMRLLDALKAQGVVLTPESDTVAFGVHVLRGSTAAGQVDVPSVDASNASTDAPRPTNQKDTTQASNGGRRKRKPTP